MDTGPKSIVYTASNRKMAAICFGNKHLNIPLTCQNIHIDIENVLRYSFNRAIVLNDEEAKSLSALLLDDRAFMGYANTAYVLVARDDNSTRAQMDIDVFSHISGMFEVGADYNVDPDFEILTLKLMPIPDQLAYLRRAAWNADDLYTKAALFELLGAAYKTLDSPPCVSAQEFAIKHLPALLMYQEAHTDTTGLIRSAVSSMQSIFIDLVQHVYLDYDEGYRPAFIVRKAMENVIMSSKLDKNLLGLQASI